MTPSPVHRELVERFYRAFSERDHRTMAASYHADAHFSDPIFTDLRGTHIANMWRMLCERGQDLSLSVSDIAADGQNGRARWQARYTFSATGRKVHNIIAARFRFSDEKIIEHVDSFSLWRWMRMALGPIKGGALGWLPPVQSAVRQQAASNLARFVEATS